VPLHTDTTTQLAHTDNPLERAHLLDAIAKTEHAAGRHAAARLAYIVAESERLLADSNYEPTDPAWDDDAWWPLAGATLRPRRAELLETIHREWALPLFGDEAEILLRIAETERAAADVHDRPPTEGRYRPHAHDEPAPEPTPDKTARHPKAPSTTARDVTARAGRVVRTCLLGLIPLAALVALVLPAAPWQLKMAAGLALTMLALGWLGWQLRKGLDR
jgi:hypothetical protein